MRVEPYEINFFLFFPAQSELGVSKTKLTRPYHLTVVDTDK